MSASKSRIGHRAAHDERIGDRAGAIGEGNRAGLLQETELSHLASGELLGDRRHGMHVDNAGVAGAAQQEVDDGGIVHDRIGRRLADDGGDAARRRRGRAGGDGLAIFVAGLADEAAHVDEAGGQHLAAAGEDLDIRADAGGGQVGADRR